MQWFPELKDKTYITDVWLHPQPIESWFLLVSTQFCDIATSTLNFDTTTLMTTNSKTPYYWGAVFHRLTWSGNFFPLDLSCWHANNKLFVYLVFSCFFKRNFFVYFYALQTNKLQSLSRIFSSFTWVERETKEFYNIFFTGLKDSRRLLTDYTTLLPDYKHYETRGYNSVVQDLYYKGVLHWLFVFSYLTFCLMISLCFLNKGLLSLLLVSEVILLMLFIIALTVASLYNIYYMLIVSFFILIFGGLELALNLLIMLM